MEFIELEGAYLVIALFVIGVAFFVTTRNFMPKNALKKGLFYTIGILTVFIISHYFFTINRIKNVKESFNNNQNIICENKEIRKVAQTIIINKKLGWNIKDNTFVSPTHYRGFHMARCVVE